MSLPFPFAVLTALHLLLCCFIASYVVAGHTLPRAGAAVRFCAAAVVGWWLLEVFFYGLAGIHAFNLTTAVILWSTLALAAWRVGWRQQAFASDVRCARVTLAALVRGPARLPIFAVGLVAAIHLVRGLSSPPLAWDALTYHLVHAARWVQHGGFSPQVAPDAWSYYEFFPHAGDVLWAWAMLPVHGDALLAPAGTLVFTVLILATYAAGRSLRLDKEGAALAALAVAAAPAVLAFVSSAYVDNASLAGFALGVLFLSRTTRHWTVEDCTFSLAAFALCAAVKPSGLPIFALGLIALVVTALSQQHGASIRWLVIGCLAAAGPLLLQIVETWTRTGSPLYPLPVQFFDWQLFPGNHQLEQVLSGAFHRPGNTRSTAWGFLLALFLPSGSPHLNFGPGALILACLGVPGVLFLCLHRETRVVGFFLALASAVAVALVLSPGAAALRMSHWSPVSGRLLASVFFGTVLGAAVLLQHLPVEALWRVSILVSAWFSLPRGVSSPEAVAIAALLGTGGLVVAGTRAIRRGAWAGPLATLGTALVGTVLFSAVVYETRLAIRHRLYAAAAAGDSFDLHRLESRYADAWPIWERLDQMAPQRIAVVAGWDGIGHNVYRYPLFGADLRHEVLYVTPTCSGDVIDYEQRSALEAAARAPCWLQRLLSAGIDIVVTLAPRNSPEVRWVAQHPEVFERLAEGPRRQSIAFRVDRGAARRLLASAPPARDAPLSGAATRASGLAPEVSVGKFLPRKEKQGEG